MIPRTMNTYSPQTGAMYFVLSRVLNAAIELSQCAAVPA